MDKPLIVFVTASFPRFAGGGSRVIYQHASLLAARGYRIRIVHTLNLRDGLARTSADVIRNKWRDLRYGHLRRRATWMGPHPGVEVVVINRLTEIAELEPPDLYVTTFWATTPALAAAAPHVACLQFMQAYESWATAERNIDAIWRLKHHKAVVSRALACKGIALGVRSDRIHRVPNGLDLAVYRPSRPVGRRRPHVAFLAHESPVKGLTTAIEAAERIHSELPDVPITAFGGARRPAALPTYIRYVRGATGPDLVSEVYSQCSVFMCPSISEGWGYPSMEAMACGAALVSTDNGGIDDFAVDGQSARITPVGDAAALAASALALLNDPEERDRMAMAGMESARRFPWAASGDAFHQAALAAMRDGAT